MIIMTIQQKVAIIIIALFSLAIIASPTVYADKNKLSEQDVDELCDASEDYEAHKEQCDKLYDSLKDDDEHERDEDDLKDNQDEDACYYEGFRIDNDNSMCD